MSGVELYSRLSDYWDLVPAVIGGIIGALAGGIPAWLLAKRQSDETLRRDREQRTEGQKALAFSSSVKLLHIINSIFLLNNHVKSHLALLDNPDHQHMEPWQVLLPQVGHTDEDSIRFTAEEMAVFGAADEYEFMQDMMLLAARNAASHSSFQEYCKMRDRFRDIGPMPVSVEGGIGSSMLTQQEVLRFLPYTIPMNDIALQLDTGLDQDEQLARTVAEKFGAVTSRYFNVDRFVSLTIPSDDELAAQRIPNTPAT